MPRIVFICTANICRSPMAHAILAAEAIQRRMPIEVFSAGVDDYGGCLADRQARLACDRNNTPMPKFVATYADDVDLSGATRIFVMEHRHVERLQEDHSVVERVTLLGEFDPQRRGPEIEDPIGSDPEVFEACYLRLRDCIRHYLDTTEDFRPRQVQ